MPTQHPQVGSREARTASWPCRDPSQRPQVESAITGGVRRTDWRSGERDLVAGVPFSLTTPKSRLRHSGACLGSCGARLGGLGLELKNVYLV